MISGPANCLATLQDILSDVRMHAAVHGTYDNRESD